MQTLSKGKLWAHFIVLLEDLSEACEIEVLIVLQEDEAEVELAEGQLEVMNLAGVNLDLLGPPVKSLEGQPKPHPRPSPSARLPLLATTHTGTEPLHLQLADIVVQLRLEVAELAGRLCQLSRKC